MLNLTKDVLCVLVGGALDILVVLSVFVCFVSFFVLCYVLNCLSHFLRGGTTAILPPLLTNFERRG